MVSLNFSTLYSSNIEDVTNSSTTVKLYVEDKGLCSEIVRKFDVGQVCDEGSLPIYVDKDLSITAPDGYYYFAGFSGVTLQIIDGYLQ
jgi:hypothetical protein